MLAPLLQQIVKTIDPDTLRAAEALQAVGGKLTEAQTQQVLAPLLEQIGKTPDSFILEALAKAVQAMGAKLTEAQAQQALAPLLQQIGKATYPLTLPLTLQVLAEAVQAVAAKLTETQTQQVLPLLQQIRKTSDPDLLGLAAAHRDALGALAEALQAVSAKLTNAQAQQALAPLLQQIGKTTAPDALLALAPALQAVGAKLTEVQAQQALAPLLQQISETTDPDALGVLAQGLQAIAGKLTEAQAQQVFTVAMSSLAWAAKEDEAVGWARVVVTLLPSAADHADQGGTRKLVSAIVYPFAAGPATEVLLDALRARHSDAPAKEAGTIASVAWIAEKYPNEARRPICLPPPQPTSLSDLKCPL